MTANRFSSPSGPASRILQEQSVDRGFLLAVTAKPPEKMACDRAAATIVALQNQSVLDRQEITSRIRYDHLVGMGYVHIKSEPPARGDWSEVKFTGKDGIRSFQDLERSQTVVLAALLSHQHEALQKSGAENLMVSGQSASDRQILMMTAAKGVSWVTDYAAQGSPVKMLEEIPSPLRRIIMGDAPSAVLRNHKEMEDVDVLRIYRVIAEDLTSDGLPVSFDRMIGMGMVPMDARAPSSAADMASVRVTLARDEFSMMEVVENGSLREAVGMMFVSEARDNLMPRWEGSEIITPEQAVAIAAAEGPRKALKAALEGPEGEVQERIVAELSEQAPEDSYENDM